MTLLSVNKFIEGQLMNRLFQHRIGALALMTTPHSGQTQAQTCPFDDGNSPLEVDGLILSRYALGVTGAPLVASTIINPVDAPTVEATINCPSCIPNNELLAVPAIRLTRAASRSRRFRA